MVGLYGDKTAWMLVRGIPICVSTDRIRPCTPDEALAYQYLNATPDRPRYEAGPPGEQQTSLDARGSDLEEDACEPQEESEAASPPRRAEPNEELDSDESREIEQDPQLDRIFAVTEMSPKTKLSYGCCIGYNVGDDLLASWALVGPTFRKLLF